MTVYMKHMLASLLKRTLFCRLAPQINQTFIKSNLLRLCINIGTQWVKKEQFDITQELKG
jgi:hypothetical protein